MDRIHARAEAKLALFEHWHRTEAESEPCPTGGRHGEYERCDICDGVRKR